MNASLKEPKDMTPYRQATLVQREAYRVCWLPSEGLKPGLLVKLKGDENTGWWYVNGVGTVERPAHLLHTDWNVGGVKSERKSKKKK